MAMNWEDRLSQNREEIASRESPYDLGVFPDPSLYNYSDPRAEQATIERWKPILDELGIEILGIRDVPSEPFQFTLDGILWNVERLRTGNTGMPPRDYHRFKAAETKGVKFRYYLYGKEVEEQFDHPEFYPFPEQQIWHEPIRRRDPCIIGVIATSPNRGVWCLISKWLH